MMNGCGEKGEEVGRKQKLELQTSCDSSAPVPAITTKHGESPAALSKTPQGGAGGDSATVKLGNSQRKLFNYHCFLLRHNITDLPVGTC